ncbi:MAG: hypothetical protein IT426_10750 [Pirellulales bacterium]|nr:hypothetical protein [Pirellulales bacterium]
MGLAQRHRLLLEKMSAFIPRSGIGPFFGGITYFAPRREGDSPIFAAIKHFYGTIIFCAAKIGTVPCERLRKNDLAVYPISDAEKLTAFDESGIL